MIARLAIIFVGFILFGVALNICFLIFTVATVGVLGIESSFLSNVLLAISYLLGAATAIYLVRKIWPKD